MRVGQREPCLFFDEIEHGKRDTRSDLIAAPFGHSAVLCESARDQGGRTPGLKGGQRKGFSDYG